MSEGTYIPEGYKSTELGVLPEEWDVVPLNEVLSEIDLRLSEVEDSVKNQFQVLSLTKNFGLIWQSERFEKRIATIDVSKYKVVKKGQIVYNPYVIWEGAIHILRYYDEGLVSPAYRVWQARRGKADPFFIDHNLRTPYAISEYNRLAAGAVNRRRSIRKSDFLKIKIPLPPLSEQRAIAITLRTVQEARENNDAVISAIKMLKMAMMKHIFTYGPIPPEDAERVVMRETEIGEIPDGWGVTRLGDVSEFLQYGTSKKCDYDVEGYPVLRIPNITNGMIDSTDLKSLDITSDEFEKMRLKIGDILFVRTNGARDLVGRSAIYQGNPENSLFASYLIRVRLKTDRALPEFVQYYSETSQGREFLSGRASGSADGKFNINTQTIKGVILPLPNLSIQKEMISILSSVDQKIAAEQSRKEALDTLFTSLLHDLMTAKVRVKNIV